MQIILKYRLLPVFVLILAGIFFSDCQSDDEKLPPSIRLIYDSGFTQDGDTLEIGKPITFKVAATGIDANLTNFKIEKIVNGSPKTVLDSGLNSMGFTAVFRFYQNVEDRVEWKLSVMDRNRLMASVAMIVIKDPNSQFGGILEYSNIRLGYQDNTAFGHFFLPLTGKVYFEDSATINQAKVDILAYYNLSADNGVLKPSPTFSSPGEENSCTGLLYTDYYPFLCNWSVRNYTKYDIRDNNGITQELYDNAHNDSLLIVSYDDVWGKKKYKWASNNTFIPFQNSAGKKGIIKVINAEHSETGSISFSLKIQL